MAAVGRVLTAGKIGGKAVAGKRWKNRPEGSNWGDFGPDDQLGRLNLLTPEKVLQGIAEVRAGKSFCLSMPLDYPGGSDLNTFRQAVKLDDVKQFFKKYYSPNNASLAIVGDVDTAQVRALVTKYFGTLKRGPEVQPVSMPTPKITSERRVLMNDRVQLARVYMGWISPVIYKPGDAEADVAATILGGGRSSRSTRPTGTTRTGTGGSRTTTRPPRSRRCSASRSRRHRLWSARRSNCGPP